MFNNWLSNWSRYYNILHNPFHYGLVSFSHVAPFCLIFLWVQPVVLLTCNFLYCCELQQRPILGELFIFYSNIFFISCSHVIVWQVLSLWYCITSFKVSSSCCSFSFIYFVGASDGVVVILTECIRIWF